MKILVAEDEGLAREVVARTLTGLGYDVVAVADGQAAWSVLQQPDAPHLAVLDWMMPGLDGPELCRRLRARGPGPYVYVILLTAKTSQADVVAGLNAGADDYILKPFHRDELEARVRAGRRIVDLEARLLEAKEQLRQQATSDPLTGLLNHGAIQDVFRTELRRSSRERGRVGLVLMDLDHFKAVNDTHGHLAGDAVLREAAQRMRQTVRTYDHLGRYGGEEFLLVVPGCALEETRHLAERIRQKMAVSPFATSEGDIPVTMSLGVTCFEAPGPTDMDVFIRAADAALYRAKRSGRNRVELATLEQAPVGWAS